MSASPVFSSAALGRPFLFPAPAEGLRLQRLEALRKLPARVTAASRLEARPAPEMVSSGIRELDALTGGLPRGCLTEICGPASSGRTSILLSALAHTTQRGEVCALVDASDTLDPASAVAAGVGMGRLLWVRCREAVLSSRFSAISASPEHNFRKSTREKVRTERKGWESQLEQVLKVTDLLLQSNGFGMIALDLGDIPVRSARRIPLASWFRFRRVVEHTPTVLLVLEQQPIAGSCSSVLLKLSALSTQHSAGSLAHTELLNEFEIEVELLHSRLERKPVRSATTKFHSRAAWAG